MNDPLFPLLLALRYMHIFGAIALMGGTIYARFAVVPTLSGLDEKMRGELQTALRMRWTRFVHLAVGLLLVSGFINLGMAARYSYSGMLDNLSYNMIAGAKFLLALPIFFLASVLTGRSASAQKFQSQAPLWQTVNLVLATLMVLIGGFLRFTPRELKPSKPAQKVAAYSVPAEKSVALSAFFSLRS